MKKSFVISLCLLFSGIVIGGGGTYLVHLSTSTKGTADSSETGLDPISIESAPTTAVVSMDTRNTSETSDRLKDSIEDSSLENDSFRRTFVVYSYVAGLSEQQISKELLNTTGDLYKLSPSVLQELQTALVEKLALLNPEAAVNFAVDQKGLSTDLISPDPWIAWQFSATPTDVTLMPLVRSVFMEWAMSDLDEAVNKAKTLNEDVRKSALAGILAALSNESLATYRKIARQLGDEDQGLNAYVISFSTARIENPKATFDEIVQLINPENFYQAQVLVIIAQQWYQQDGLNVLDEINEGTLDEYIKSNIVYQVLETATTEDPEQAFRYALTLPTQGSYSAPLSRVAQKWAISDPQAAFDAVTSIEQSGLRESLQRGVISVWANNEPYYLLDNLDSFPTPLRDAGTSSALEKIARTAPQEAAELALKQKSGMMGSLSYLPTQIMRHWIKRDVEAAVNWVFNGPVNKKSRYNWVSALATNLVESDPRRAFEIALKQPIDDEEGEVVMGMYRTPIEAQIISQLVYADFDLAVELLPRVREGYARTSAYTSVGYKYIDRGDATEAVELGLKLSNDEQASYFQSIAYSWARVDPGGMVESLKSVPTANLRSSIARNFLSPYMKESFTESQLEILRQYLSEADKKALEGD